MDLQDLTKITQMLGPLALPVTLMLLYQMHKSTTGVLREIRDELREVVKNQNRIDRRVVRVETKLGIDDEDGQ